MNTRDTLLVILTTLIWGFNFVVIKWGVQDVSAPMMTALRFTLVAVPLIFFVKRPNIPLAVTATYGLLFGCGIWGLVNFSISLGTPAGQASLLLQSSAFMTVIAGVLLFSEEISAPKVVGILLALVGFVLIAKGIFETNTIWGMGLVLLAGLSWTICNVIIRYFKPLDVLGFVVWSSLFVPIPLVFYLFFFTSELTNGWNIMGWRGIVSIVFQAGITTILGYGIWTNMINKYGLATVSPYSLLVPVSGLIFAWAFFGETAEPVEFIGSAFVLIGLTFMSGTFSATMKRIKMKKNRL